MLTRLCSGWSGMPRSRSWKWQTSSKPSLSFPHWCRHSALGKVLDGYGPRLMGWFFRSRCSRQSAATSSRLALVCTSGWAELAFPPSGFSLVPPRTNFAGHVNLIRSRSMLQSVTGDRAPSHWIAATVASSAETFVHLPVRADVSTASSSSCTATASSKLG